MLLTKMTRIVQKSTLGNPLIDRDRCNVNIFADYFAGVSSTTKVYQRRSTCALEPQVVPTMQCLWTCWALQHEGTHQGHNEDRHWNQFTVLHHEIWTSHFNISLDNWVPLKYGGTLSLFKYSNPTILHRCLSISILSPVFEAMERMLDKRLYYHAEQRDI